MYVICDIQYLMYYKLKQKLKYLLIYLKIKLRNSFYWEIYYLGQSIWIKAGFSHKGGLKGRIFIAFSDNYGYSLIIHKHWKMEFNHIN